MKRLFATHLSHLILGLVLSSASLAHAKPVETCSTSDTHHYFTMVDYTVSPVDAQTAHNLSNYIFTTMPLTHDVNTGYTDAIHLIAPNFKNSTLLEIQLENVRMGPASGHHPAAFQLIRKENKSSSITYIHQSDVTHTRCKKKNCVLNDKKLSFEFFASMAMIAPNLSATDSKGHWKNTTPLSVAQEINLVRTNVDFTDGFFRTLDLRHYEGLAEIRQGMILLGKDKSTGQYTHVITLIHNKEARTRYSTPKISPPPRTPKNRSI